MEEDGEESLVGAPSLSHSLTLSQSEPQLNLPTSNSSIVEISEGKEEEVTRVVSEFIIIKSSVQVRKGEKAMASSQPPLPLPPLRRPREPVRRHYTSTETRTTPIPAPGARASHDDYEEERRPLTERARRTGDEEEGNLPPKRPSTGPPEKMFGRPLKAGSLNEAKKFGREKMREMFGSNASVLPQIPFDKGLPQKLSSLIRGGSKPLASVTEVVAPKDVKHFGIPLEESWDLAVQNCQIHVTLRIFDYIRFHGKSTLSIFRIPPNKQKIEEWKEMLDSGQEIEFENARVHDVAGFLQTYLRALPNGLIPDTLWTPILKESKTHTNSPLLPFAIRILQSLPKIQKFIGIKFLQLLSEISRESETNKMDAKSLAVCVSQSIFRNNFEVLSDIGVDMNAQMQNSLDIISQINQILCVMIQEWDQIESSISLL